MSLKLMSFTEMGCLSRTIVLCFLTIKTAHVLCRKIPFFSRSIFSVARFIPSFQRGIADTSDKCTTKSTFAQSLSPEESTMGKKQKSLPSEIGSKKNLKLEAIKGKKIVEKKQKRPNYFVAVQISNPDIHEAVCRIQNHIIAQNRQFNSCMNSIATLHITLMVMSISDAESHKRALKALQSVHDECNDQMCKTPLRLEFCGLANFKNRVLYAKIKKNESFERLCDLAERVRKHFADFEISSSDHREFNPHLTIAKIDFSKKKHKVLKKIEPSSYETFLNEYIGSETVVGIQLLSMTGPKNEAGYYMGKSLIFESTSSSSIEANMAEVYEKKKGIQMRIANLARKIFK